MEINSFYRVSAFALLFFVQAPFFKIASARISADTEVARKFTFVFFIAVSEFNLLIFYLTPLIKRA